MEWSFMVGDHIEVLWCYNACCQEVYNIPTNIKQTSENITAASGQEIVVQCNDILDFRL